MEDTSYVIEQKLKKMFQEKNMCERAKMASSMFDTSKYLVTQAIKQNNPDISETDLKIKVFLQFYGDDFDEITKEKIVTYFSALENSKHNC